MTDDKTTTRTARRATGDIVLDEFVPRTSSVDAIEGDSEVDAPRTKPIHQDQHPHYTHELPDSAADAVSRVLIRIVPLAYGLLIGGLSDNMPLGLALGAVVGVIADLSLREHSFSRVLILSIRNGACPAVAKAAHGLATVLGRVGGRTPTSLSQMQCKTIHP